MHDSAHQIGGWFFGLYWQPGFRRIVEIGSCNVNGTLRDFRPPGATYIGLDLDDGPGVNIKITPGERLPIEDGSADVVLSSSAFEHDPCFWRTFLEMARIVAPGGFIYINAPSNGPVHRYPADCWRFYPDAGKSLALWASDSGHPVTLMESFTALPQASGWCDFVAVFRKSNGEPFWPAQLLSTVIPCTDAYRST